jgi:hypothetical protein
VSLEWWQDTSTDSIVVTFSISATSAEQTTPRIWLTPGFMPVP